MAAATQQEKVAAEKRGVSNLEQHLAEVFAEMPVGSFLTTRQITGTPSSVYPDPKIVRQSDGAVNARLFPASGVSTLPGVRATVHPVTGVRGAMKVVTFDVDGVRWETGPARVVLTQTFPV
jgi:hypothetical protein